VLTSTFLRSARRTLLVAVVAGSALGGPALGQDSKQPTPQSLLADFEHYVLIDNKELAASSGQALLDMHMKPADFLKLVVDSGQQARFDSTIIRAQGAAGTEAVAAELLKLYEQGKLDIARNADEIAKNIGLLTGNQRQRMFAIDHLKAAGEYATPQLLQAFMRRSEPVLQAQARIVLQDLGQQAIAPLSAALMGLDDTNQEAVAYLLGDMQYKASLPALYELKDATKSAQVKGAAEHAIARIDGSVRPISASKMYEWLAEEYYKAPASLTSFPGEDTQAVWNFKSGAGLYATPVATPVFHETMAMRLAEHALQLDPTNASAVPLWIAANFSREIETPEGYQNPMYADRREAMYYGVAAGADVNEHVLARALDNRSTPLARRAIAAIEKTAGAGTLWTGQSAETRKPLLEALGYPNRRVQYEAALALGTAGPRAPFTGSERVVPILAGAVRDAGSRYALVLASDVEQQSVLADALRGAGYTVLAPARALREADQAVAEAPAVDLIVIDQGATNAANTVAEVRGTAKLAATPTLVLAALNDTDRLSRTFYGDQLTTIARQGINPQQLGAAGEQAVEKGAGGLISPEEAERYKSRTLDALRDLAVSGNPVLNVSDAAAPLIATLPGAKGPLKLRVAEVLSYVCGKPAQVALVDAALDASGADRVALLGHAAASARRCGNMLEGRQVTKVLELARTGKGEEATAAAALAGALRLPSSDLLKLILDTK
jgi:CheY-like chemotaxis protein